LAGLFADDYSFRCLGECCSGTGARKHVRIKQIKLDQPGGAVAFFLQFSVGALEGILPN